MGTGRRYAVPSTQETSAQMYDPKPGDAKPPVFEPMEMSTAEALLKEAKEILDGLGIVFFCGMARALAPSETRL